MSINLCKNQLYLFRFNAVIAILADKRTDRQTHRRIPRLNGDHIVRMRYIPLIFAQIDGHALEKLGIENDANRGSKVMSTNEKVLLNFPYKLVDNTLECIDQRFPNGGPRTPRGP